MHYAWYGDVPLPSKFGSCQLNTLGDVLDDRTRSYVRPAEYEHPGSHFCSWNVDRCLAFMRDARRSSPAGDEVTTSAS